MARVCEADFITLELDRLREDDLHRSCLLVEGEQEPIVRMAGHPTIMLSSNNYLGLATHPRLRQAAKEAIDQYGSGAGGSRLISGNMTLHEHLEQRIARFKHTEAALVFNSGYTANVGLLSALVGAGDAIFSDELNHASIVDGCRLSRAQAHVYRHKNTPELGSKLAASKARRKLIVTDGVFSMDGDLAPLPEIVSLAKRYGAMLMVDDAHATGVIGAGGRGTASHFGVEGDVDIQMGTLSKALGGFGAYIAGSATLREFLVNKSRAFIFTTALPPAVLGAALAAFDVVESEPWRRHAVCANAAFLRDRLTELGFDCGASETQIIPVIVGDAAQTIRLSRRLLEEGVFAHAIRPPTVPNGQSRLRVTAMATHTAGDLDHVVRAFETVGRELGVIR